MGRPRIPIDWKEFDKLCGIQCLLEEIAAWFECTIDTIENRVKEEKGVTFSEYYRQKCGIGKIALRRQQFQLALKGDRTMLIWLGKQRLGQAEKQETQVSGPNGGPQVIVNLPANGSEKPEDK